MALTALIQNYTSFNTWANQQFAEWLKKHPVELLTTEVKSSFSTIDFTLQHMLRTQRFWLLFIEERSIQRFNWAVRENAATVILDELTSQSVEMEMAFKKFSADELEKKLVLQTPWAKNSLSRFEYIMHVINHGTFHRGQIVTMARTLGITQGIPATDYNIFRCA